MSLDIHLDFRMLRRMCLPDGNVLGRRRKLMCECKWMSLLLQWHCLRSRQHSSCSLCELRLLVREVEMF